MNDKVKRIIVIVTFILIVIGLAYAIYYLFFKPITPERPSVVTPSALDPGQLPGVTIGNINQIISNINGSLPSISRIPEGEDVSKTANGSYTKVNTIVKSKLNSPKITTDGAFNYFNDQDGRFYRMNADGSIIKLADQRFFAVSNIIWSNDSDMAILEYPDGSNIIYNFSENKQYTLPQEFQDFDIASNGNSLAAEVIGPKEENNWIVTADSDGTNIQFIERISDQSANVDINISPNNQVVALFRKNTGANSQEIIFIGKNQENFKSLTTYGRGFEGQWTPDGNQLLYSVYNEDNGYKPTLWVAESSGNRIGLNNASLGLETWPSKCTFSEAGNKAYCGVPDSLPTGSGIYPDLAAGSFDSFYEIDLQTGQNTILALPVGDQIGYSATNVFLSPNEDVLYFQDYYTGYLQSIDLE